MGVHDSVKSGDTEPGARYVNLTEKYFCEKRNGQCRLHTVLTGAQLGKDVGYMHTFYHYHSEHSIYC